MDEAVNQEVDILAKEFGWGEYTPKFGDIDQMLSPKIDKELALFFNEWLTNGRNATQAYRTLHPNVTEDSARVLGSRKLTKVSTQAILSAYGLTYDTYFQKLKEGLEAKQRNEATGVLQVDHKTRRIYLKVLGELLGIEERG